MGRDLRWRFEEEVLDLQMRARQQPTLRPLPRYWGMVYHNFRVEVLRGDGRMFQPSAFL